MLNKAMERKLKAGECLDVRKEGQEIRPGLFELRRFVEESDYCDAREDAWIWSIGRDKSGTILASTSAEFYQHPEYECLFLR